MGSFRVNQLRKSTCADKIFDDALLLQCLKDWGDGKSVMDKALFDEVLSYGLGLVVMQCLEARHHIAHQRASPARAGTVAYISANMRRKFNPDVHQESFRANVDSYLQHIDAATH